MKDLVGKRVLITGAGMGMGRLYTERAVGDGATDVVMWDVDEHALENAKRALAPLALGRGARLHPMRVDVSDAAAVRAAADQVRAVAGPPHVVINNAGIVRGNAYFWELTDVTTAEQTIKVNTLAPMYVAHAFLPDMIASKDSCRLVNIASAAGLTANPRMSAYCASKWGAVGWSESVRLELGQAGHRHVKVTTVCPYYVKTGMFDGAAAAPLLPLLAPENVVLQVWESMKSGAPMLVLPRTVLLNEAMKGVLPTRVRDTLSGILGVHRTMEHFTGRPTSRSETPAPTDAGGTR